MKLVNRLKFPRHDGRHGVYYGKEGTILVIGSDRALVWQPGGSYWSGMNGTNYDPASLEFRSLTSRSATGLHSGGRLSQKLIDEYAHKIDKIFNADVARHIVIRKTLILDDDSEYLKDVIDG